MSLPASNCCPACGRAGRPDPVAAWQLHLEAAPQEHSILACTYCGMRWMVPYADPKTYAALYSESYFQDPSRGVDFAQEKKEFARCYELRAQRFARTMAEGPLLDVGCATGDFLQTVAAYGIPGWGLEPSSYAADEARRRGLSVDAGTLEDAKYPSQHFGAGHMSHVLEHVPDVNATLGELARILRPGAPLYIEVPLQFDGVLDRIARMRRRRPDFSAFSIHHHYFFSPRALTRLLGAHGFHVESCTTFLPCMRSSRRPGPRKWALQGLLWLADRVASSGDLVSVWARRLPETAAAKL